MLVVIFWLSGLTILFTYAGYPLLLRVLTTLRPMPRRGIQEAVPFMPRVTLLVSVYNEEKSIEAKIQNALALDYPRQLVDILVVSDGSTDRTDAIVARYAGNGVRLLRCEGRIGKTACLNRAVPRARGDIVVFSDANSEYERGAIRELVRPFVDERVGFVSGITHYLTRAGDISDSIGLYWRLEQATKEMESALGSCVGADGAIFAIRKGLYRPLHPSDINDLVIPLRIVEQGYRGTLARGAMTVEETAGGSREEFGRQVRISNRTIRALMTHRHLLNPFRYGWLAFELFCHRVCRLLVPFLMATLLVADLLLIDHGALYAVAFAGQVVFYVLGGLPSLGARAKLPLVARVVSLAHAFSVTNSAIAYGWLKFLRGETTVVWAPARR